MTIGQDLLDGPPPTLLPADNRALEAIAAGKSPEVVAAEFQKVAWLGQHWRIKLGMKNESSSPTHLLELVTTEVWIYFVRMVGKALVLCLGVTSQIVDSCAV